MANSTIKRNATARAGYEFQDLVGIELLSNSTESRIFSAG